MPINYPLDHHFRVWRLYAGGYCSSELDNLMGGPRPGPTIKALYPYEDYVTKNLPVLWLPLQPYQQSAISPGSRVSIPRTTRTPSRPSTGL